MVPPRRRGLERRGGPEHQRVVHPPSDDLHPDRQPVVGEPGGDGSRVTDLAEQAGITKQTAGFLVDQLERAGYGERVPDPADGRARLVRITERGAQSVAASAGIVAEVEAEWTAHIGVRRMDQLRRILADLREITDPWR